MVADRVRESRSQGSRLRGLPADAELQRVFELPDGRLARVRFTTSAEGDLRVDRPAAELVPIRARLVDRPWTWLAQAHETTVVAVRWAGDHAGARADAAVTHSGVADAVLAIHTADCAPVALVSPEGVLGAVHGGWRGLAGGVVEATVALMRTHGASTVRAVLGPCIHEECYEFGRAELDRLTARFGDEVRGMTSEGKLALNPPIAVATALRRAGVEDLDTVPVCTACDNRFFSHRARSDRGRQAMLVWLE